MEVHHHPHAPHSRKKFKEYFFEFLMIFLAVTMGFLAENLREENTNSHRERGLMISMMEDLKNDSLNISSSIDFCNYVASGLDSLSHALFEEPRTTSDAELQRLNSTYMRLVGTTYSDQTSSQLKAGGMNLIRNRSVANGISNYWNALKNIEQSQENYRGRFVNAAELSYSIFNGKFTHVYGVDSATHATLVTVDPQARLMTSDPLILLSYGNRIRGITNILKNFLIRRLMMQKKECLSLTGLIGKEYHLEE